MKIWGWIFQVPYMPSNMFQQKHIIRTVEIVKYWRKSSEENVITKIIQPVSTFTRRVVGLSNQIILYTVIGVLSGSQSVATLLPMTDNLLADLFYGIFILNTLGKGTVTDW